MKNDFFYWLKPDKPKILVFLTVVVLVCSIVAILWMFGQSNTSVILILPLYIMMITVPPSALGTLFMLIFLGVYWYLISLVIYEFYKRVVGFTNEQIKGFSIIILGCFLIVFGMILFYLVPVAPVALESLSGIAVLAYGLVSYYYAPRKEKNED